MLLEKKGKKVFKNVLRLKVDLEVFIMSSKSQLQRFNVFKLKIHPVKTSFYYYVLNMFIRSKRNFGEKNKTDKINIV